jgi:nucleoid-associated protein YgaU
MAREMRVGLSIIVGLLIVLGGVIYYRVDSDARRDAAMKKKLMTPAPESLAGEQQLEVTRGGEQATSERSPWEEQPRGDFASAPNAAIAVPSPPTDSPWSTEQPGKTPGDEPIASDWPSPVADPAFAKSTKHDPLVEAASGVSLNTPETPHFAQEAQDLQFDDEPVAVDSHDDLKWQPEPAELEPNRLSPIDDAPAAAMAATPAVEAQPPAPGREFRQPTDDRWARRPEREVAPAAGAYAPPVQQTIDETAPYRQAPAGSAAVPADTGIFDPQKHTYTVGPNENFWSISKRLYGSGAYFKALYEHNRRNYPFPNKLRAGDVIAAPSMQALEQTYPHLCPKRPAAGAASSLYRPVRHREVPPGSRVYVVQQGDTLSDIARHELGRTSRWAEIYELNREVLGDDFNRLQPGTQLVLPGNSPPDRLTEAPSAAFQR